PTKEIPGGCGQQLHTKGGRHPGHQTAALLQGVQIIKAKEVEQHSLCCQEEENGMVHLAEAGKWQESGRERERKSNPQGKRPSVRPQHTEEIGEDQTEQDRLVTQRTPPHNCPLGYPLSRGQAAPPDRGAAPQGGDEYARVSS